MGPISAAAMAFSFAFRGPGVDHTRDTRRLVPCAGKFVILPLHTLILKIRRFLMRNTSLTQNLMIRGPRSRVARCPRNLLSSSRDSQASQGRARSLTRKEHKDDATDAKKSKRAIMTTAAARIARSIEARLEEVSDVGSGITKLLPPPLDEEVTAYIPRRDEDTTSL